MVTLWLFVSLLALGHAPIGQALKLPSYIKPCARDDPKFNECAIQNGNLAKSFIVNGDRKYRMPSLNPLEITQLTVDDRQGPVGLKITLNNVKIYGIPDLTIEDFSLDFKQRKMHYQISIPRCEVISDYDISGRILVLPIVGQGKANFTLLNLQMKYDLPYQLITKASDGKRHFKLLEGTQKHSMTKAHLRLDNLFNGDKLLGEQMNLVINDNWEVLVKDVGPPIAQSILTGVQQGFENLVDKVAVDDMFV